MKIVSLGIGIKVVLRTKKLKRILKCKEDRIIIGVAIVKQCLTQKTYCKANDPFMNPLILEDKKE